MAFGLRDPIPLFPVPLREGDVEPIANIGLLLQEIYAEGRYDLRI